MSFRALQAATSDLPFVVREQVLGYAESVQAASPSIAREAGVEPTKDLTELLTFLAGVRKLHDLVASSYWALDNSAKLLAASDIGEIRIGAQDFSRGGEMHTQLKRLLDAQDVALERAEVKQFLNLPYAVARVLARNGRR